MSWFKEKKISHTEYLAAFLAGMDHALRLNQEFNQIFISKKLDEETSKLRMNFESIIERHKNRVEEAASPYAVTLYDATTSLLQEARQDKDPERIKKYQAQIEVLEKLVYIGGTES